jgi:hypothetical protein
MMAREPGTGVLALVLASTLALSCTYTTREVRAPGVTAASGKDAKFHLRDGSVVVLATWRRGMGVVNGVGVRYDAERTAVATGALEVRLDEVLLVETTEKHVVRETYPMIVLTILSLSVTVACALDPKACFGSCPTFYVRGHDGEWTLQAEGFSTSIARALEAEDTDELPAARAEDGVVTVAMRNEALETHVVTGLSLLAVTPPEGARAVQHTTGGFAAVASDRPAASCDVTDACAALRDADFDEWIPESDGQDLAARTSIVLTYDPPGARDVAVVLTARNSLMTTFLLYHMLALHGTRAGELIARIERRDPAVLASFAAFKRLLGGVDVSWRQDGGAWRPAGTLAYSGPIARTTQGVALRVDDPGRPVEVKLELARADWRLDAARLGVVVAPRLRPEVVLPEAPIAEPLVTLPGDEHVFRFRVGDRPGGAYFLRSRGWYYEWIRREWLDEEDLDQAAAYLADPARALRELAPAYRSREATMNEIFERSRFRRVRAP